MTIIFRTLSFILVCLTAAYSSAAQTSAKSPVQVDSLHMSHISVVRQVGVTDTMKTIIRVQVKETGSEEPIQGATVLLRRDLDKMLGRVSRQDGRCNFMPIPAVYAVRVQLTGYKTFEHPGLEFEKGKVYEMVIRMAHN